MSRWTSLLSIGAVSALLFTGCAGSDTASEGGSDENAQASSSEYVTEGKFTVGTGEPAYAPWVLDDAPESGEGFEAAVAYAVAEKLGFEHDDVVWVRTPFDAAIAPGPKDFDVNIQQFSVTIERAEVVDFSSPYYTTTQAVVANKDSDAGKAKTLADLKSATIGVASGTTSLSVTEEVIAPDNKIQVFNSLDDTVAALQNGTIDALVTDLPGAFYVRDAQLDDGVIVGQLESNAGGDEFAFVLPKGSKLTAKVTEAVDELQQDGTLEELVNKWIADQGAPVLK